MGGSSGPKYTNAINCATTVLKDEGFTTFFKGCGSNILRGLCGALVLVGFDYCKDAYIDYKYGNTTPKAWADMEVQELDCVPLFSTNYLARLLMPPPSMAFESPRLINSVLC